MNQSKGPRLLTIRADALMMPDGTPLKNIEKYRDQDVLCGRGGGTNHHRGNAHWRKLVNSNKRLYLSLPKKQKALVAKSIVHTIRAQNPPGRFLARNPANSLWSDIGDQKAAEKTSQALREGAPDIRTEMAKEGHTEKGILRGQILKNGLIGLDDYNVDDSHVGDSGEGPILSDPEDMRPASAVAQTSRGGQGQGQGGNSSMMMAFHQYLGGKQPNPNPSSSVTQPKAVPKRTVPGNPPPFQPSLLQQPASLSSLAASRRQLLHTDLGMDNLYQQTALARKLSGQSINRPILDSRLMTSNLQQLDSGRVITYNDLAMKAADISSRAGMQRTNQQSAQAMRYHPGQLTPSLNGNFARNVPSGAPLSRRPQLTADLLQKSSLPSAAELGRTRLPGNNPFGNSLMGETSIETGGKLISQAETNAIARLVEQKKSLLNNTLRQRTMARLDPPNLYTMTSSGQLPTPVLRNETSLSSQFHPPAAPSDYGKYIGNGGLGTTTLQPSVSAVMAKMKFELLMKKNMQETETPYLNVLSTQQLNSSQLSHLNPMVATQQLNLSQTTHSKPGPVSTQEPITSRNGQISITETSAPKRGVSASLDDLCRAAGLGDIQPSGKDSGALKKGYNDKDIDSVEKILKESSDLTKITPKERETATMSDAPKLGVNDSSLLDGDSDDEDATEYLTAKRKRVESSISVEEDSKRNKVVASDQAGNTSLGQFSQTTERLKDNDLLTRGSSLNRISNVNFAQTIKNLPLSEATLDRGHSLAMSEISLDRGPSLSGIGLLGGESENGQFDDASEDEEQAPTFAPKPKKVDRGCTLGTINTFPLNIYK